MSKIQVSTTIVPWSLHTPVLPVVFEKPENLRFSGQFCVEALF